MKYEIPKDVRVLRHRAGNTERFYLLFPNCAVPVVVPCLLCGHHSKGRRDEAEQSCMVPIYSSRKFTKWKSRVPCSKQLKEIC